MIFSLKIIIVIAISVIGIAMAFGWRPSRLSLPSLSGTSWNWKKWLCVGLFILLAYVYLLFYPEDLFGVIFITGFILIIIFWKQILRLLAVSIVFTILIGMGGCFLVCGRVVGDLHKEHIAEIKAEREEAKNRFPSVGEGTATKTDPLRCYLDPWRSRGRGSAPVKFVPVKYPNTFYIYSEDPKDPKSKWPFKEAGNYLVYPVGDAQVQYRWWQVR